MNAPFAKIVADVVRSRSVLRFGPMPVWRDSRRADTPAAPQPQPVQKKAAIRLYHQAREIERRTRTNGRQDGKITRNGLAVLHALVFDFHNWGSGRCDPSCEDIAAAAAISIRSVHRGLAALKRAGLIAWVRRCIADADAYGRFILKQISSLYALIVRSPGAIVPEAGTWGEHPNDGDALGAAIAGLQAGLSGEEVLTTLQCDAGLGAALARLGTANFGCRY